MRQNLADLQRRDLSHVDALHGYITASRQAYRIEMPGLSAFPRQNFGLGVHRRDSISTHGCLDGRDALKSHDRWLQGGARPCRSSVEAECQVSFRAGRQDHKGPEFPGNFDTSDPFCSRPMQAFAAQTQEFHKLIGDAVQNAGRPPEKSLRLKSDAGRSPKTPPAFACSQAEPSPSPVISRIG